MLASVDMMPEKGRKEKKGKRCSHGKPFKYIKVTLKFALQGGKLLNRILGYV